MHACMLLQGATVSLTIKNTFHKMLCKYCALSLVLMQLANCKCS